MRPVKRRRPPAENADDQEHDGERRAQQQGRNDENASEERDEAVLWLRRVDREVDRVAPGGADEARERSTDDEQKRADVDPVPHPVRDEPVQRGRCASGHERDHPGDYHGRQHEHTPESEPDDMWEREQRPKEDGQPRPFDGVRDLEADGVRWE